MTMMKFGVSQSTPRTEDLRFLTGGGRYIDDIAPAGALHAVFLRSPMAHARITALDTSAARGMPGVVAVITAADLEGKLENAMDFSTVPLRGGKRGAAPRRPMLAEDTVRYVGEAIACIIAETREAGRDAAEAIDVEFDEIAAHVELAPGGTALHAEAPENLAFDWHYGDRDATDRAFAEAAHTVRLDLVDNRVICNSMEPRGCYAEMVDGRLHHAVNGQGVWGTKATLAKKLGMAEADVRVTTPDVGGGFGMKGFDYPEQFVICHAARELDRPVRWMSERGEAMLTDTGCRDLLTTAEAAFDADHNLLALRIDSACNLGAYNSTFGQMIQTVVGMKVAPGVHDVQTGHIRVRGIYTNTAPVDAYRGAGRPESIYCIERLMDHSARQLGTDPVTLHRKTFIPRDKFPYRTFVGETYDTGDFHRVLDRAVERADWAGFAERKAEAARRGKLRGIGLCFYIESILGDKNETTTIEFTEDGHVNLYAGTQSNGQGHETVFAQVLHSRTGIPFEKIRYVQGDSDRIATGGGTGGSRSGTTQSNSINATSDVMIDRFKDLAEEELEVAKPDITFEDGVFAVAGTDKSVTLMELAGTARQRGMTELLRTTHEHEVAAGAFPYGAHIAEVEVDPQTGHTECVKYTVVDDFGVLMNPMIVEGQVHGGVAQGLGQALVENCVYDETGQLVTGSFMDYAMPRADNLPNIDFTTELIPTTTNEIGMRGCGEAGTVGAMAAVTNAALDAVWDAGVRHVDMPITPMRMWQWLDAARATQQAAE